jgi:hypothetical protein
MEENTNIVFGEYYHVVSLRVLVNVVTCEDKVSRFYEYVWGEWIYSSTHS